MGTNIEWSPVDVGIHCGQEHCGQVVQEMGNRPANLHQALRTDCMSSSTVGSSLKCVLLNSLVVLLCMLASILDCGLRFWTAARHGYPHARMMMMRESRFTFLK